MSQNDGKYHNKKENKKRVVIHCPYCSRGFRGKTELALHMLTCKRGD